MILDPNRKGVDIYYHNKLRCLEGSPEVCLDYIIKLACDVIDYYSESKNLYQDGGLNYKGKHYIQLSKIVLDCNCIGRVYVDLFGRIGLKYDKLDVKRIMLD